MRERRNTHSSGAFVDLHGQSTAILGHSIPLYLNKVIRGLFLPNNNFGKLRVEHARSFLLSNFHPNFHPNQVVLEETGVERYVHLRSVDDEYEHLESTLPSRARNAGAAGGVGGNPPAEGVESGPGANENSGDVDTVIEGGDSDGRSAAGEEPAQGRSHQGERDGRSVDGGSEQNSGTHSGSSRQQKQQQEHPGGDRNQGQSSSEPSVSEQRIEFPYEDDDAELNAARNDALPRREAARRSGPADASFVENPPDVEKFAAPSGIDDRKYPSPSPPSAYHYRSPSCSPRLSPRPMRSPYRQEGVGGRESSRRGESSRNSGKQCKRQEEQERRSCSPAGGGGDAARRARDAGGSANVAGAGKHSGMAGENDHAKTHEREEKGDERALRSSSATLPCSPLPGPVSGCGDGDKREASAQESRGDDIQPDAWFDNDGLGKPLATRVDESKGAFVGSRSGGLCGGGLEGLGLADSGGFADGYEGSVVFIDNQNHEGGGGQDYSLANAEEGWWQPESGSVLRGVDFAFEGKMYPRSTPLVRR